MVFGPSPWILSSSSIEGDIFPAARRACRGCLSKSSCRLAQHAFADAGNVQQLLRFVDQVGNLLRNEPQSPAAALRYERMRNESCPSISSRSAVSYRMLAMRLVVHEEVRINNPTPRNYRAKTGFLFERHGRAHVREREGHRHVRILLPVDFYVRIDEVV